MRSILGFFLVFWSFTYIEGYQARADVDVHLMGVGSSSSLLEGGSRSSAQGVGLGYGGLLAGRLTDSTHLRFGGWVLDRKTRSGALPTRKSLFVPLLFGHRLFSRLTFELGGFYDYAIEATAVPLNRATYGAVTGFIFDAPLVAGVGLLLGAHYTVQVPTLAMGSEAILHYSDFLVTAGFRLGSNR